MLSTREKFSQDFYLTLLPLEAGEGGGGGGGGLQVFHIYFVPGFF